MEQLDQRISTSGARWSRSRTSALTVARLQEGQEGVAVVGEQGLGPAAPRTGLPRGAGEDLTQAPDDVVGVQRRQLAAGSPR